MKISNLKHLSFFILPIANYKGTDFPFTNVFFLESACDETHEKHGFNIIGSVWTKLIEAFFPFFIINHGFRFLVTDLGFLRNLIDFSGF
jgi:hypothetical protein